MLHGQISPHDSAHIRPFTAAEPTLYDTMPDIERLTWAIEEAMGVEKVEAPFPVMVKLASTLRKHSFTVCVKGELAQNTFRCMEICGPENTAIVGCAIDIGTTTVTMVLTDLTTGKLLAHIDSRLFPNSIQA